MKKSLLNIYISIELILGRFVRSVGSAVNTSFTALTGAIGKVVRSDQRLFEVQQMTDQEVFTLWTANLGLEQTFRRHILEDKYMNRQTGEIEERQYSDEEKERAELEIQLIEEDLWALAAAYKRGKVQRFVEEKRAEPMYTPTEIIDNEDGTWTLINKETNEAKIIDENGKEIKTVSADEVAYTPKVSSVTDTEGLYTY